MPRIEAIEIDDHILDKIESRHGVELYEAEEICYAEDSHFRRGRDGLPKVFGQTAAGRCLFVVLADHRSGVWKLVTAREMTHTERRLYQRARGE
jgi:hypothetical protein